MFEGARTAYSMSIASLQGTAGGMSKAEILGIIKEMKDEVIKANDLLYSTVATKGDEWKTKVNDWHDRAIQWMELSGKAIEHPDRAALWKKLGGQIAEDAFKLAKDANSSALESIGSFAMRMPKSLQTVLVWTATTAGKTVGGAVKAVVQESGINWWKLGLWGGAVLGGLWVINKKYNDFVYGKKKPDEHPTGG